jgi:predicted PurR-regulated permease PerM
MITKEAVNRFLFDKKGWIPVFFIVFIVFCVLFAPTITSILLFSLFFAYAIDPFVNFMSDKLKIPRFIASGFVIFLIVLIMLLLILIVLPGIFEQVQAVLRNLDVIAIAVWDWLNTFMLKVDFNLEEHLSRQELIKRFSSVSEPVFKSATNIFGILFRKTFGVISFLFSFTIFIVITFFSSSRYPQIKKALFDLTPPQKKEYIKSWLIKFDRVLSGFIRGQITVCFVLGCIYSGSFAVAGIPNAASLGAMIGVFCIVPYVGLFTAVLITLFLALAMGGPLAFLKVALVFLIVQIVDTIFITPNIMGKRVGISPVFVIIALFAGAEVGGFLGVLIAVPSFAILKLLGDDMMNRYKSSSFYSGNE